ncbi:hhh-Gpd family protein [Arthrobacter sp. Hiyo8]|uniref:HhH-GPD family protein n=1 Tax=Arthrobacter bambusae TaxID=1338426 RepID=A0AAW8DDL9_9MICC|nr:MULTISPECIES: HhH-GPD-type base excision DNA repair protein [Arthrobacter]BAS12372.1 hhh-Gpd family protein [Arthrobacter sp. Hiyo8]MDP9904380.1 putative HhH-GPD family protein [Arthrobacter bambusae]MDQ0127624.1 putative HhH-GPD family protein [Arthrobacter bambusae]MDQ0178967.1 putative HhH-GPD family protein [Arthrobacter bambusae]GAP59640.1 hhh-Gpd family protein [Arthrobacter sp. Hiyo1]
MELHITGDPAADQLLSDDAFALLIGMLLDQQVTMESAFAGPEKIRTRIGSVSPATIAEYDPDGFVDVFKERPSVHRFPGSMASRVQDLAAVVQRDWNGDATAIWTRDEPDGQEVLSRLKGLPGFGEQKAKIFLALLGKQRGLQAPGWREAAGAYGQKNAFLSVADIVDPESLRRVRANKQAAKAAIKAAKASGS